jgi:hypothetical protein
MIIIPTSRPMVLKSIASTARSCSRVFVSRTSDAPSSAIFVRSTRSVAMIARATTKMMMASVRGRSLQGSATLRRPGFPAHRDED